MNASVTLRKRLLTVLGITAVFLLWFAGAAMAASESHWLKTDTYKLMNFAVLAIALFFLLKKPLTQALNARIQGIREQLEELEGQKKAAEEELAKYNEKLATLEGEAEEIVAEYVRQGEEAKARILAEAEKTAEKLEEQAKKNIENEFKKAKDNIQAEIIDQALEKAEEIIKSKISDDDQDSLVDEYLDKVVA